MKSLAAALFPPALASAFLAPALIGQAPAFGHALVDVQADLSQREKAVMFERDVGTPFPAFHLLDPDGKSIDLQSLRGKVVVLDFTSTSNACTGDCVAQSKLMSTIQADVAAGHMADQVDLISVSLDPAHDTAAVRKAYGPAHGLVPGNWTFAAAATGDDTRRLTSALGLKDDTEADGPFKHSVVTYVIDSAGMLRARFFGVHYEPLNLIVYVNALTNDHHELEPPAPAASGAGSLWQSLKRWL